MTLLDQAAWPALASQSLRSVLGRQTFNWALVGVKDCDFEQLSFLRSLLLERRRHHDLCFYVHLGHPTKLSLFVIWLKAASRFIGLLMDSSCIQNALFVLATASSSLSSRFPFAALPHPTQAQLVTEELDSCKYNGLSGLNIVQVEGLHTLCPAWITSFGPTVGSSIHSRRLVIMHSSQLLRRSASAGALVNAGS